MFFSTDDDLVEHLYRVVRREQAALQAGLKAQGLTVAQARTLGFIARHPGAIQRTLSQYLAKPDATTTNLLKGLEAKGLVTRRVQPEDERQKQLFLTPSGTARMAAIQGVFADLEQTVSAPLSPEEKQMMLGLLRRIDAHLAP